MGSYLTRFFCLGRGAPAKVVREAFMGPVCLLLFDDSQRVAARPRRVDADGIRSSADRRARAHHGLGYALPQPHSFCITDLSHLIAVSPFLRKPARSFVWRVRIRALPPTLRPDDFLGPPPLDTFRDGQEAPRGGPRTHEPSRRQSSHRRPPRSPKWSQPRTAHGARARRDPEGSVGF